MLRGPQTVAELRTRSERLYPFPSVGDVERSLGDLSGRELVERLPRRVGEREERWRQLLGDDAAPSDAPAAPAPAAETRPALEERVARLERELEELRERLDALTAGEDAIG
jgi:uncharacterized protein YceH (UPF0502 family)